MPWLSSLQCLVPLVVASACCPPSRTVRFLTFPNYLTLHMRKYVVDTTSWTPRKLGMPLVLTRQGHTALPLLQSCHPGWLCAPLRTAFAFTSLCLWWWVSCPAHAHCTAINRIHEWNLWAAVSAADIELDVPRTIDISFLRAPDGGGLQPGEVALPDSEAETSGGSGTPAAAPAGQDSRLPGLCP